MASQVILLEDGWNKLKSGGVNKIEAILEDMHGGVYKDKISTEEYSALYTTVYTMCTQKPPNNWSEHLYNNYCDAVKDYLSARILPRIKEKHDEAMLTELVRRWENHKLMCARASPAAAAALSRSLCTSLGTRLAPPHTSLTLSLLSLSQDQIPLPRLQIHRPLLRQAPLPPGARGGRLPVVPRHRV